MDSVCSTVIYALLLKKYDTPVNGQRLFNSYICSSTEEVRHASKWTASVQQLYMLLYSQVFSVRYKWRKNTIFNQRNILFYSDVSVDHKATLVKEHNLKPLY